MKNLKWLNSILLFIFTFSIAQAQESQDFRNRMSTYIEENKLVPDLLNAQTFDQQTFVVKSTEHQIRRFVNSKNLDTAANRTELFEIWSAGAAFDLTFMIATNNKDILQSRYDLLLGHARQLIKSKSSRVSKKDLQQILLSLAFAKSESLGESLDSHVK